MSENTEREVLWPAGITAPTAGPARPMPTEADTEEIARIAAMVLGDGRLVFETAATSGGVLLRYHRGYDSPASALEEVGYTVTDLRAGLLLVTGRVDRVALLDAQISALKAERERLLEATTGAPF